MSKTGESWAYTYDADGLRTQRTRTANNVTTTWKYVYNGSQLVKMVAPSEDGDQTLAFAYDAEGTPLTVRWNSSYYYYITNIQGDVIGITDSTGNIVVTYTYDAWGNPLSTTGTLATTLGTYNPLRYRGYVYDTETGLYYLQSRYYDSKIGRFINADSVDYLGVDGTPLSYNLFAYCNNNPIMLSDYNGHAPEWWQWAISGAMLVAGVALVATGVGGVAGGALISAGANSIVGSYTSEAAGGSSVSGWVGGMITGAVCGAGAGFAGSLLVNATNTVGAVCIGNIAASGAVAFSSGFVGSALGQVATASIDGMDLNTKDLVLSSAYTGAVNCFAGIMSGMGTALQNMPRLSTTTTVTANSLNAAWSIVSESVSDFLGSLPSILP